MNGVSWIQLGFLKIRYQNLEKNMCVFLELTKTSFSSFTLYTNLDCEEASS